MKFSWSKCADVLMMSRTTLWRRAVELGISNQMTEISDAELDSVVRRISTIVLITAALWYGDN